MFGPLVPLFPPAGWCLSRCSNVGVFESFRCAHGLWQYQTTGDLLPQPDGLGWGGGGFLPVLCLSVTLSWLVPTTTTWTLSSRAILWVLKLLCNIVLQPCHFTLSSWFLDFMIALFFLPRQKTKGGSNCKAKVLTPVFTCRVMITCFSSDKPARSLLPLHNSFDSSALYPCPPGPDTHMLCTCNLWAFCLLHVCHT